MPFPSYLSAPGASHGLSLQHLYTTGFLQPKATMGLGLLLANFRFVLAYARPICSAAVLLLNLVPLMNIAAFG